MQKVSSQYTKALLRYSLSLAWLLSNLLTCYMRTWECKRKHLLSQSSMVWRWCDLNLWTSNELREGVRKKKLFQSFSKWPMPNMADLGHDFRPNNWKVLSKTSSWFSPQMDHICQWYLTRFVSMDKNIAKISHFLFGTCLPQFFLCVCYMWTV